MLSRGNLDIGRCYFLEFLPQPVIQVVEFFILDVQTMTPANTLPWQKGLPSASGRIDYCPGSNGVRTPTECSLPPISGYIRSSLGSRYSGSVGFDGVGRGVVTDLKCTAIIEGKTVADAGIVVPEAF